MVPENKETNATRSVVDFGLGPISALGDFAVPMSGFVFVFNALGLSGMPLAFRRGGRCGVRGRMRRESFAQNVADLVGPATVVLDDFVNDLGHVVPLFGLMLKW